MICYIPVKKQSKNFHPMTLIKVQQASLSFRDAVDNLDIRLGNQVDPKAPFGSAGPKVLGFTEGKNKNP